MPNYRRAWMPGGTYFFTVNPLKQGQVSRVADWPYSTFHRLVEQGLYNKDWAESSAADTLGYED